MENIEKEIDYKFLCRDIYTMLAQLKPKEALLIILYFGLYDGEYRSYTEIGRLFNRSRSWAKPIICKSLRTLRHPNRTNILKEYLDIW